MPRGRKKVTVADEKPPVIDAPEEPVAEVKEPVESPKVAAEEIPGAYIGWVKVTPEEVSLAQNKGVLIGYNPKLGLALLKQ